MIEIPLVAGDLLYDYNASGEVSIRRAFEDYPTLDGVVLSVPRDQLEATKAALFKGAPVTALGMPWVVVDVSWVRLFRYQGGHEVTLSLQHPLAPMDSEIVSRRHPLDEPTDISGLLHNGFLNLKDLVSYVGRDWHIPFGEPDEELRVTPREMLEEYRRRLHAAGSFLYWGGTEPEARAWARQTTHDVPRILNESLEVSEPGQGATVDGVQCTAEVVNAEFVPDGEYGESEYDFCETLKPEEPANGADNFLSSEAEQIRDKLNKGAVWFDSGGPVKEWKQVRECNGSPVWTRIKQYGLRGSSIGSVGRPLQWSATATIGQSHYIKWETEEYEEEGKTKTRQVPKVAVRSMSNFALASFWGEFSDVTDYVERDRHGYCTARWKVGYLVYRFKTESNAEAQQTYVEEELKRQEIDAKRKEVQEAKPFSDERIRLQEEFAALQSEFTEMLRVNALIRKSYAAFYAHYWTRQNSLTSYDLDSLCNYYADLHLTPSNPHKFCRVEKSVLNWLATMPDPERTGEPEEGEAPPLLSVGQRYEKERIIKISIPAQRGDRRKPERFSEELPETNAEGAEFKDRIILHPITWNEGRPSEHDRVKRHPWSKDSLPIDPEDPDAKDTLILNSPGTGYNGTEPPQSEWSSPGVWRQDQAVRAMNVELSVDNTQNAKTTSFRIPADLAIVEGDSLNYGGEKWIVLGVDLPLNIQRGLARCEVMEVNVGRLMAFGHVWEATYPTAEDYPPGLVYPGLGNAPTVQTAQKNYTFVDVSAVLPFDSGAIFVTVQADQITEPSEIPFSSGTLPSVVILYERETAPAIMPFGSGAIASQVIIQTSTSFAIMPFDSGAIASQINTQQESGTAFMPFSSRVIHSQVITIPGTGTAPLPFSSGTVEPAIATIQATGFSLIPFNSGTVEPAIVISQVTSPAILSWDSGTVATTPADFQSTSPAILPWDSGTVEPTLATIQATGFALMPWDSGTVEPTPATIQATNSAVLPWDSGTITIDVL